jgi:hypothetical protein
VGLAWQSTSEKVLTPELESPEDIEHPILASRSSESPDIVPPDQNRTRTGFLEIESTRLSRLQAMHEYLLKCPAGTEIEWRAAFDIMIQAMLADKDLEHAFIDGHGVPFKESPAPQSFHTYDSGRQYTWSQEEYPILASMFGQQAAEDPRADDSSQPVQLQLTEAQREAAFSAYNEAVLALTESTPANKK